MKRKIAVLALGALLLLTMAFGPCNLIQELLKEKAQVGATVVATAAVPSEPGGEKEPTPTPGKGQATPSPGEVDLGGGKVTVPVSRLRSYRAHQSTKIQQPGGSWTPESKMDIEWTSEPQEARHVIVYNPDGSPGAEFITIGSKTWIKVGDGWVESPEQPTEQGAPPVDVDQALNYAQNPPKPLGKEKVNGIQCQQYLLDADFTAGDSFKGHMTGNIWVADQGGIPPVIVKSRIRTRVEINGEKVVVAEERELYDINTPITIEPPTGK